MRMSTAVLDLTTRRSARRAVIANVVFVTLHMALWFVDWSIAPEIDQAVLLESAIRGVNASTRAAHQVRHAPAYIGFFAVRCVCGFFSFLTMALVFGGSNDPFVLRTLVRSTQPVLLSLKLVLYFAFTTMVYVQRAQFDLLEWPRFVLAPCLYVSGMGLIILCDANRRAQKLRWACVSARDPSQLAGMRRSSRWHHAS